MEKNHLKFPFWLLEDLPLIKSGECKLYYRIYDLSTGGDRQADKAATELNRVICQRLKYLLESVILSYMSVSQMQNVYKISGWQELREFCPSLNWPWKISFCVVPTPPYHALSKHQNNQRPKKTNKSPQKRIYRPRKSNKRPRRTRLTYNCAHLRTTRESLTVEEEKRRTERRKKFGERKYILLQRRR